MARHGKRPFDLVLWGATGFTGRLVAEYLAAHRPKNLRWAIAGRSEEKLRETRDALAAIDPLLADLTLLVGDSHDRLSLDAIAFQSRVVCSTVGPYALHGTELVGACVQAGTDYCDLTGEVQWIRRMIDIHHQRAMDTSARIVCCCGFDSIPSDLGCLLLQNAARERHGAPCRRAVLYVDRVTGGFSGGTFASIKQVAAEASRDHGVRKVLSDPYSLNPESERSGPDSGDSMGVGRTSDGRWTAPFFMGAVNMRVVRRSNALLGFPYGRDFSYSEQMRFAPGPKGFLTASAATAVQAGLVTALAVRPIRALLDRTLLPAAGEGPSREARERGYYRIRIEGEGATNGTDFAMTVRVEDSQDPGYGSTSKMLAESALSLAFDERRSRGGVLTPASAMGVQLVERLRRAGMTFEVI
jgi:short subunit dehydrogenase-like uncharacterized protein